MIFKKLQLWSKFIKLLKFQKNTNFLQILAKLASLHWATWNFLQLFLTKTVVFLTKTVVFYKDCCFFDKDCCFFDKDCFLQRLLLFLTKTVVFWQRLLFFVAINCGSSFKKEFVGMQTNRNKKWFQQKIFCENLFYVFFEQILFSMQ